MDDLYGGFLRLTADEFGRRFLPLSGLSTELVISLTLCLELDGEEAHEQAVGRRGRGRTAVPEVEGKRRIICAEVWRYLGRLSSWAMDEPAPAAYFLLALLLETLRASRSLSVLSQAEVSGALSLLLSERLWHYRPSLAKVLVALKWMLLHLEVCVQVAQMEDTQGLIVRACADAFISPDEPSCSLIDSSTSTIATTYLSVVAILTSQSLALISQNLLSERAVLRHLTFLSETVGHLGSVRLMEMMSCDDEDLVVFALYLHLIELRKESLSLKLSEAAPALFSALNQIFAIGLSSTSLFCFIVSRVFFLDVTVAIDFLCQPETPMLEYFIRLLRYLSSSRDFMVMSKIEVSSAVHSRISGRRRFHRTLIWRCLPENCLNDEYVSPSEFALQERVKTMRSSIASVTMLEIIEFLDKLSSSISSLYAANAFPFAPNALISKIDRVVATFVDLVSY